MMRFGNVFSLALVAFLSVQPAMAGNIVCADGAQNGAGPDEKIVLRLMGDSTMADKDLSGQNPERGWGQRLPSHLDSCVTVANYAQNGRSTKSFVSLGLWDKVKKDLKAGEYLFIQFGHNDAKESDSTRYAPAFGLYQDNLRMFVSHALSVGAKPILFTPVSRRWFDDNGRLKTDCHGDYPEAARQVAEEFGIPLVDANAITQEWLSSVGDEASRKYYMWLPAGVCPRHPDGLVDNTHTNVAGARKLVELLLPAITGVIPELAPHITYYDFVVAKDGSGDFFTVQEAVDAAPDYCKQSGTRILIREGLYREKLTVPSNKQKLHLTGENVWKTVISWDDYALKAGPTGYPMGTSATSTVFMHADDFLAENLTFENTAGEGKAIGQACAITVDGDRAAFLNCRFSERKVIKTERIRKIVVSAIKQSLKARLPKVNEMTDFNEFISRPFEGQKFIAHCYEGDKALLKDIIVPEQDALILIGPEGDFSEEEVRKAQEHGFRPVSLGRSRLRTETAALVACHILNLQHQL